MLRGISSWIYCQANAMITIKSIEKKPSLQAKQFLFYLVKKLPFLSDITMLFTMAGYEGSFQLSIIGWVLSIDN